MYLQHPLQTLCGIGFINFKNVGQQLVLPDLYVLQNVMMMLLEFNKRFKKVLERVWELPVPSWVFHFQQ